MEDTIEQCRDSLFRGVSVDSASIKDTFCVAG